MTSLTDQVRHASVLILPLVQKTIRFGFVGITSSGIYVVFTALLVKYLPIDPKIASALGYFAALPFNFIAHRQYTFVANGIVGREIVRFIIVHATNIAVSVAAVAITVDGLGLSYAFGMAATVFLTWIVTFLLLNVWVFKQHDNQLPTENTKEGPTEMSKYHRLRASYRNAVMLLCVLVAFVCAVVGLETSLKAGPIWDDPTTISMMTVLVEISKHPEQSYEAGKSWIEGTGDRGAGYYGVVTQYAAHALETIANGTPWYQITYSADAIVWRHVVCFIYTMIMVSALYFTVGIISRSWRFGIIALAVLLSTPIFLGLSVIDEKDVPITAGMTLLSSGTALLLWRLSSRDELSGDLTNWLRKSWAVSAVPGCMIFLGTLIAFGSRVGALALIGVECTIVCILMALSYKKGFARIFRSIAVIGTAVGAAMFIAVVLNPLGRKAPLHWIVEGVLYAKHPATQNLKLYGQTVHSGALPWWYVPGWIVAEYPAAFMLLLLFGLYGIVRFLSQRPGIAAVTPWVPFAVQGFFLPLCIILSGAVLHDRLRHLHFIVPPLCLLAAYGLFLCVNKARFNKPATIVLAILGPALLLFNFATTLIWYPYQYAYLSEIARSQPQFAFDNEPLGLSITEAVSKMRKLGIASFRAGPAPIHAAYEDPLTMQKTGVSVLYVGPGTPNERPVAGGGAYYLHTRPSWNAADMPSFCRTLFQIKRQGVVLGVGGEC